MTHEMIRKNQSEKKWKLYGVKVHEMYQGEGHPQGHLRYGLTHAMYHFLIHTSTGSPSAV